MIPVKDILKTLRTIINESATEEDSFTIETDEAIKRVHQTRATRTDE